MPAAQGRVLWERELGLAAACAGFPFPVFLWTTRAFQAGRSFRVARTGRVVTMPEGEPVAGVVTMSPEDLKKMMEEAERVLAKQRALIEEEEEEDLDDDSDGSVTYKF